LPYFKVKKMSNTTIGLDENLYRYYLQHSLREPAILTELRELTRQHPMARMQIAPEQGQFMQLLIQLTGAKRAIEVGVFTGYSALATAMALPDDGLLVACDIDAEVCQIAQDFWQRAGVADKIDLRVAPALESLQSLLDEGQAGSFDFAFIDADKESYSQYFEACLTLLTQGGLIAVDNVLWGGDVADPNITDADTQAIRDFNQRLLHDDRVDISMIPIADGLTLARKNNITQSPF
jgi:predicted O-methyltransferase YrrM